MTASDTPTTLRSLADFLDANPELGQRFTINRFLAYVGFEDEPVAILAAFARAGKAAGLSVTKEFDESYGKVLLTFGQIELMAYASREQVCERVVTGVETITEQVPDPDALATVPTVEVTHEIETVEWVCSPLLAAASEQVSA